MAGKRWTEEELAFDAKLRDYIERHRAAFEAKLRRPPSKKQLDDFWLWEAMIEETEWEKFYGEPLDETA